MDLETQHRATTGVLALGLGLTLVVSIASGTVGFGIGWSAAAARSTEMYVVSRPGPTTDPSPAVQPRPWATPTLTNPEPDYLRSVEAMRTVLPRLRQGGATTGRFKTLAIQADNTLVALIEVEGNGIDSVAFSFGHTVRNPVPLTPGDVATHEETVFTLTDAQLASIPVHAERILQEHPHDAWIEQVVVHGLLARPIMQFTIGHPRIQHAPVHTDLDGRRVSLDDLTRR
jgi:hypothetical protein